MNPGVLRSAPAISRACRHPRRAPRKSVEAHKDGGKSRQRPLQFKGYTAPRTLPAHWPGRVPGAFALSHNGVQGGSVGCWYSRGRSLRCSWNEAAPQCRCGGSEALPHRRTGSAERLLQRALLSLWQVDRRSPNGCWGAGGARARPVSVLASFPRPRLSHRTRAWRPGGLYREERRPV